MAGKSYDSVKDSGERRDFGTGSVRDMCAGKGRMDLLPFYALIRLSKHFENGAVKYGDRNWELGVPLATYVDSALRHCFKLMMGLDDEDHAAAVMWNIACYIETERRIELGLLPEELANMPDTYKSVMTELLKELEGGK